MADTTIQKQGEVFISQSEYDALRLAGNLQSNTKYHITKVPIDSVPTEGSNNLITSGGVFDALSGKLDASKNAVETVGGLVTPMSAPASVSIAAVDTTNAQTMLTIGDGLSVENGVLKATGGGAGSSSGSGVQVPADWNVNNESDPSFIKNKPFGYGSVAVVFRKDSLDEYGGHHGDSTSGYIPHVFFVLGQNELTLVDGETYHVKCSSDQGAVEYAGKARNMGGVFVLGDCILEDGSRNPNFNVAIMVGETYDESNPPNISIAFNDLKADAEDAVPTLTNVSIIIEKCAIKKIPSWFLELPDIKVQTVYMIYKSKYDNGDYNANGSITGKPIYEAVNNGSTIYYVDDSSSGPHFANRYYTMTSIWIADSCGDGNFNIDCTYTSWEYDTSGAYVCKENTLNMGFTNA